MRIVSLVPSATDIVCALGLADRLVGVSHECDEPTLQHLPRLTTSLIAGDASSGDIDAAVRAHVGAQQPLYGLDAAALRALEPDVIITQALCNVCAVSDAEVRAVACTLPHGAEIINLEPRTLTDVFGSIRQVAAATGRQAVSEEVIAALEARVDDVARNSQRMTTTPRVAFLEWLDPPFSGGHWNPGIVRLAGGLNGFGDDAAPATTVRWDDVWAWNPEVVFIACCGFSVERTLADLPVLWSSSAGWEDVAALRSGRIYVSDGMQYFSRPGPKLIDSLEILAHALDPLAHPLSRGLPPARRVAQAIVAA